MKTAIADENKMIKKVGGYVRVSTPRQAAVEEGSRKNQVQHLKASIEARIAAAKFRSGGADQWTIVDWYVEEPRSGTETSRRLEYQRLMSDVKRGRINTVMCVSLSRISRSVKDFLELVDFLHAHDADIVSLKEDFDSTTPQGKAFMTILLALYQFEAEIGSQRVVDSLRARSERGLWVSGQILGYDLDPAHPGYLIVNEREAKIVNFAFDKYLELGSIPKVVEALNKAGFRTKEYTSRRGEVHSGKPFVFTSIQNLLKNRAFIAEKETGKFSAQRKKKRKGRGFLEYESKPTEAWKPIVSREKFDAVQKLLAVNTRTKHNGVDSPEHLFVLNGGILRCDKCGGEMVGAGGTSKTGRRYFYYRCRPCRFRVSAPAVEDIVRWRLRHLCRHPEKLEALVARTNERLRSELPKIQEHREMLRKELEQIKASSLKIMSEHSLIGGKGVIFVQEALDQLADRRVKVEEGLAALEEMIKDIERDMIEKAVLQQALVAFDELYDQAPPYLRKKFVQDLLGQVRVSDLRLAVGLDGRPGEGLKGPEKSDPREQVASQGAGSLGYQTGGADGI